MMPWIDAVGMLDHRDKFDGNGGSALVKQLEYGMLGIGADSAPCNRSAGPPKWVAVALQGRSEPQWPSGRTCGAHKLHPCSCRDLFQPVLMMQSAQHGFAMHSMTSRNVVSMI